MPEFAVPDLPVPDHPDVTVPDPGPPAGHPWTAAMLTGELVPGAPVLGGPTVDSDADGVTDTTVAEVSDELVLATDLDHDGQADAVTRIGPDAVVTAHTGDAEPREHPWDALPLPPAWVDPRTGEWIRG
ncbi:DUF6802 family protein [Actinomycetospora sp. TBRC 11914]|uniref:DUF6802 family protein n=1 Tax=Actinomycetospora sp. TBRC 11914 TaxID=2729387 RepID=UPI00145CE8B0|nr:DUF6802 family protein [Actinomycetospora sp. TBRC 11914]NMO92028.1 hypothetical protein [Actinomycetospora sp. TBRC 11914]